MTFMLFHRWWKLSLVLALVLLFIGGSIILIASPLVHARPLPVPRLQTPILRVLFDNAHTETAGNADWVISKSQPDPLGDRGIGGYVVDAIVLSGFWNSRSRW